MAADLYYLKYVEKIIRTNPISITITRTKRIPDGFDGWIEQEVTLQPQTVSIYNKKSQRERISESGATIGYMASSIEKMLCSYDADIQEGDRFLANGREYKVVYVNSYMDICKQAELEVIK